MIPRLRRLIPLCVVVAALLAMMIAPAPVGAANMSATHTDRGIKMQCIAGPCVASGVNSGPDGKVGWHGYWIVTGENLPGNAPAVVTVTLPDGKPYPTSQYSNLGTLFGFTGNVGHTDPFGSPYWILWAGYNGENTLTDPSGKYVLTLHLSPSDSVTTTFFQNP